MDKDTRTPAQFFFEIGYGACWADAFIANGNKSAFSLTDAGIERAWAIAPECHDDPAAFDQQKMLADAAGDLLAACRQAEEWLSGWASAEQQLAVIRAAIAKAVPPTPLPKNEGNS